MKVELVEGNSVRRHTQRLRYVTRCEDIQRFRNCRVPSVEKHSMGREEKRIARTLEKDIMTEREYMAVCYELEEENLGAAML